MAKLVACGHEQVVFNLKTRSMIVNCAIDKLKTINDKFTAIAVSGYSMSIIGSIVADRMKKEIIIVRKRTDVRASGHMVEGKTEQKCVFIDDLMFSGNSFIRVKEGVESLDGSIIAVFLYNSGCGDWTIKQNKEIMGSGVMDMTDYTMHDRVTAELMRQHTCGEFSF